jgi:hypothetical protein
MNTKGLKLLSITVLFMLAACDNQQGKTELEGASTQAEAIESSAKNALPDVPVREKNPLEDGQYTLQYENTVYSLSANNAPQKDMIEHLASAENIELLVDDVEFKNLSLQVHKKSFFEVLPKLLAGIDYRINYTVDDPAEAKHHVQLVLGSTYNIPQRDNMEVVSIEADFEGEGDGYSFKLGDDTTMSTALSEASPVGPELMDYYRQNLDSPDPVYRAEAAREIIPDDQSLPKLLRLMTADKAPSVRIAATYSLENSEDPRALDALIDGLEDSDDPVVVEVLDSLEFAGSEKDIIYIEPLLAHKNPAVAQAAAEAIDYLRN